nr:hypothetical protein CKG001_02120 [Bdellovibrio sp. CKG001]
MDNLTFVAEMTKALAWPAVFLIVMILFKKQLLNLLNGIKLRRIEKGEFKAEFEAVAQEIRGEIPSTSKGQTTKAIPSGIQKKIEVLVSTSPTQAILEAWNQVEGLVNSVAIRSGVKRGTVQTLLDMLVKKGVIESASRDSVLGLYRLRNLAAHGPPSKISPKQARDFVVMSEAILWTLEQENKKFI